MQEVALSTRRHLILTSRGARPIDARYFCGNATYKGVSRGKRGVVEQAVDYGKWAREKSPLRARARARIMGVLYTGLRTFELNVSISRVFFGTIRLLSSLFVTIAPIAMKYGKDILQPDNEISWKVVIFTSGIVFCLLVYSKIYDYYVKRRTEQKAILEQREALAQRHEKATRLLAKAKWEGLDAAEINLICDDLLCCILYEARLVLRHFDERYLEASVLLFDAMCMHIHVAYRAIGIRPLNSKRLACETMAFHLAKARQNRCINSFKRDHPFAKEGISTKEASYKSILLVPIISKTSDDKYLCWGVVTIDSKRPYEFWGGRDKRIVVEMQPYLNLLRMMLAGSPTLDVS